MPKIVSNKVNFLKLYKYCWCRKSSFYDYVLLVFFPKADSAGVLASINKTYTFFKQDPPISDFAGDRVFFRTIFCVQVFDAHYY